MKKNILALIAVLALAACNNEANTNSTSETNAAAEVAQKAEIETAKVAEPEKLPDLKIMPFGMPMAPKTRFWDRGIGQYFIGGLYHEARGRLITKDNPQNVLDFYEKALVDMGFKIHSKSHSGARPVFIARRDHTGDYFDISAVSLGRKGYDLEVGERAIRVMYKMTSLDRKK